MTQIEDTIRTHLVRSCNSYDTIDKKIEFLILRKSNIEGILNVPDILTIELTENLHIMHRIADEMLRNFQNRLSA